MDCSDDWRIVINRNSFLEGRENNEEKQSLQSGEF